MKFLVRRADPTMNLLAAVRSDSAIVIAETILLAILTFSAFSMLVRVTDFETVGLWALATSLLGFSRAADFWSKGLSSFVSEARAKGDEAGAVAFVSTAVMTGAVGYFVLAGVAGISIHFSADQLVGREHAESIRRILPVMLVVFCLMALGSVYQAGFLGFGRPLLKAIQTVGGGAIFLIGAFFLAPIYGLIGIILAQTIQALAMLVYAALVFHGVLGRVQKSGTHLWQWKRFSDLVAFGSKAMILVGVQSAIEPIVRLLVNQFGGLAAVAVVEVAARLIAAARNVIVSLGQILIPAFARLGAKAGKQLLDLYRDVSQLFVLVTVPTFSLLLSAGPLFEETILGRRDTGLVSFLWLLSAAWITSTIAAPAYFLMMGRRRLRPLIWSHSILSLGSIVLGLIGGIVAGANGALAGVAVAFGVSSMYLIYCTNMPSTDRGHLLSTIVPVPRALTPLAVASLSAVFVHGTGIYAGEMTERLGCYALTVSLTLTTFLLFGQPRDIVILLTRIRP